MLQVHRQRPGIAGRTWRSRSVRHPRHAGTRAQSRRRAGVRRTPRPDPLRLPRSTDGSTESPARRRTAAAVGPPSSPRFPPAPGARRRQRKREERDSSAPRRHHAILRRGLAQIISEAGDMQVWRRAENSAQTISSRASTPLDVVLLDLTMPDAWPGYAEAAEKGKAEAGRAHAQHAPEERMRCAPSRAGASGYLNKQSAPALLVTAYVSGAGRRYISPAGGGKRWPYHRRRRGPPAHATLSTANTKPCV